MTTEGLSPYKVLADPWGGTVSPDRDKNPLALSLGDPQYGKNKKKKKKRKKETEEGSYALQIGRER